MCRALLYLGEPVLLDNLLFQPDSALVRQSYMPKMLHMLNLAGFGMRAWSPASHDPQTPFAYASDSLPVFDRNLKNLAAKVAAGCVLAHVRGVAYSTQVEISLQNVHPFQFPGVPLTLAHNGDLARFAEMRPGLARHVRPELARHIRGTTDSEWIYSLVVSQLDEPHAPHRLRAAHARCRRLGRGARVLDAARRGSRGAPVGDAPLPGLTRGGRQLAVERGLERLLDAFRLGKLRLAEQSRERAVRAPHRREEASLHGGSQARRDGALAEVESAKCPRRQVQQQRRLARESE